MKARVFVRLKQAVLDPQGEAVRHALGGLGFNGVNQVRVGKLIEVELDASDEQEAEKRLKEMADALLANPVMETYSVEIVPA